MRRHECGGRSDQTTADVDRDALASAAQRRGEQSRQVVADKTELRSHQHRREEAADLQCRRTGRRRVQVHERDYDQRGKGEEAQQSALTDNQSDGNREQQSSGGFTEAAEEMDDADHLFLRSNRQAAHVRQAGDEARGVLEDAVGAGVHARRDQGGAQRSSTEIWPENRAQPRPREHASTLQRRPSR